MQISDQIKDRFPQVSLFLDSRRAKKDGTYPVKLRVFYNLVQKLYKTGIDCSVKDFNTATESKKVKQEYIELRTRLQAIEIKAKSVISELSSFDWQEFENRLFHQVEEEKDVISYYNDYEQQLLVDSKILTAENYRVSRKSIQNFMKNLGYKSESLHFSMITVDFLKEYEKWMLKNGKSLTTVGIYLRPLRALLNLAKEHKVYDPEHYPFGKRRYIIPSGKNIKKALSKDDLRKLFEIKTESPYKNKARDFWFFSYNCNGVNIRDIAELKFKNIQDGKVIFKRTKTANTNRANQKLIVVFINEFMQNVIDRYSNTDKSPENFVFPILNNGMSKEKQVSSARGFTRFINQHIKELANEAGVSSSISTYWARHSFTTMAIRNGHSMEALQEALGHTDMKTTQNYWGGFDDSTKKELSNDLMTFLK